MNSFHDDNIHEECGVFGVFGVENAAEVTYLGLQALQHRGQEACGIVTVDENGRLLRVRGQGLVSEVFNDASVKSLHGSMAIGHVRYSTSGGKDGIDNVQPLLFRQEAGDFALCHNGNIVNSAILHRYLEEQGCLFQSTSDSEIVAHLIKKGPMNRDRKRFFAIKSALNMIEGAFAFMILTSDRLYICRDKYGFRPLALGRIGDGYVVSSETCAFSLVGATFERDIKPGEVLSIDANGTISSLYSEFHRSAMCAMEYIYFARPDSDIEGTNVHAFRKESGRLLYQEAPAEADIVVGVPDSSLSAAIGYSEASGIPYEMGLVKNRYIGRTFIQPSQKMRDFSVRMKLSPVVGIVKGKRVVLIDDSIVRGTTSLRIVRMLRQAGAAEVHVRIASPSIIAPCYYGVDISSYEELLCHRMDVEGARKAIEADSLAFLSKEALYKAASREDLCISCFTNEYPTALYNDRDE